MSAGAQTTMAKRGRPMHVGVMRTTAGQKSRAGHEPAHVPLHLVREMVRLGKLQRKWLFPLGQLVLNRKITEAQQQAGEWFAQLHADYLKAIGAPPLTAQAQDVNRMGGHDGDNEPTSRNKRTVREWQRVILGISCLERDVLERVCCKNELPDSYTHQMALIVGLDKLVWLRNGERRK